MKLYRSLVFLIYLALIIAPIEGFTQDTELSNDGSIQGQFEYLIKKSNNYQAFKVVNKKELAKLNSNVLDSLRAQNLNLKNANGKLNAQQKEINALLSDLEKSNSNRDKLIEEKNRISLFGMSLNKKVYNALLWSIIAGLIGGLLFFMFQFKNSHAITSQTKKSLAKVQDEFDLFRKKTLEKEQLLKRRLQDEINKRSN